MFRHTGTPLAAPPSESIRTGQTGWQATSRSITTSLKAAQCLLMLSKAGPAKSSSSRLPTPETCWKGQGVKGHPRTDEVSTACRDVGDCTYPGLRALLVAATCGA